MGRVFVFVKQISSSNKFDELNNLIFSNIGSHFLFNCKIKLPPHFLFIYQQNLNQISCALQLT